ncbi:GntR family transcriptional regulator [Cohnella zeiphila]|uniref:GntR family transcriptional regulator n=1 Tax=Cohnella zeiphila TaxID=2761120 RepID=A0A7X0VXH4_9BACL|nr:GntR family transcriptional regulator [Cohnella zeiphila]MBB6733447.1 GntR family transcriptional regulator [Cohnella zeiphila]
MASFDDGQPIFMQVADMIEDDILNGTYREEDQIISVAQFSKTFQINPATIVKGIALLVNEGILYKKRGLGMYVAAEAKRIILEKRKSRFFNELVTKLLEEANKLNLSIDEVIERIRQGKRS